MKKVSQEVKYVIKQSHEEAKHLGHKKLFPEHILISILNNNEDTCSILSSAGVDIEDMFETINENLSFQPISANGFRKIGRLDFSQEVVKLFENLDSEASRTLDEEIKVYHLLLSLLNDNSTTLTKSLHLHNKLSYEMLLSEINKNKKNSPIKENENMFENDDKQNNEKPLNLNKTSSNDTPALNKFCRDISKLAKEGSLDPIIGRDKEIKRVSQILGRRKKNNPILIGEPGTGKCMTVRTLVTIKNNKTGAVSEMSVEDFISTIS